jgi:hypothetical protein
MTFFLIRSAKEKQWVSERNSKTKKKKNKQANQKRGETKFEIKKKSFKTEKKSGPCHNREKKVCPKKKKIHTQTEQRFKHV